ncbi:hypothetical protein P175DRAFT_0508187 [Aspergillus ochraceoroseus IBT 24754]|uniref:Uncharacterized protein n=1 Tax=Aspergillus ochraceoroseus IBT 24754 TaxID=1392256 RepID=A0A2T5M4Q2_9EURO|nr:uncharacterized protein P175DRAFT_0508187 [Aspergillus ochraceoroseus IBT 24754]PTU23517.1 hypothetical protein P175DRAFT_0508187 [Aspergillus ochraceoroseus IBT 24754]
MARNVSHGRGGAGNIYSGETRTTTPRDLITPTIKQEVYTTGRGGSGNMMHNDPDRPEIARESQDVEVPPMRGRETPHHTGRGGAANAYIPTPDEEKKVREEEDEQLRRVYTAKSTRERSRDVEERRRGADADADADPERGRSSQ